MFTNEYPVLSIMVYSRNSIPYEWMNKYYKCKNYSSFDDATDIGAMVYLLGHMIIFLHISLDYPTSFIIQFSSWILFLRLLLNTDVDNELYH